MMKLGVTEQDVPEMESTPAIPEEDSEEMSASIDDLLSDTEDEEDEDKKIGSASPLKVFECPCCPQERTSLNR